MKEAECGRSRAVREGKKPEESVTTTESPSKAATKALDLPEPEFPSEEMLKQYAALAFLYLRSPRYADWPVKALRLVMQPPIDLKQARLFFHDGIPRGACTWAHLGDEAEAELVRGELLTPAQWRSGPNLWLMDIVAPYGQGSGGQMLRVFMRGLPEKILRFRYMRVDANGKLRKIVDFKRRDTGGWHAPVIARDLSTLRE